MPPREHQTHTHLNKQTKWTFNQASSVKWWENRFCWSFVAMVYDCDVDNDGVCSFTTDSVIYVRICCKRMCNAVRLLQLLLYLFDSFIIMRAYTHSPPSIYCHASTEYEQMHEQFTIIILFSSSSSLISFWFVSACVFFSSSYFVSVALDSLCFSLLIWIFVLWCCCRYIFFLFLLCYSQLRSNNQRATSHNTRLLDTLNDYFVNDAIELFTFGVNPLLLEVCDIYQQFSSSSSSSPSNREKCLCETMTPRR